MAHILRDSSGKINFLRHTDGQNYPVCTRLTRPISTSPRACHRVDLVERGKKLFCLDSICIPLLPMGSRGYLITSPLYVVKNAGGGDRTIMFREAS